MADAHLRSGASHHSLNLSDADGNIPGAGGDQPETVPSPDLIGVTMDIGPPVVFDFAGALTLCRDLWALADDLETYGADRTAALLVALEDWRGPEADSMTEDVWPAETSNLVTGIDQLRSGALAWADSWSAAQQMHNNRQYAIAIDQEQSTRSTGEQFVDWFVGDDSARHVPAPGESATPQAPGFEPTTGFISYIQHSHSDWEASYHHGETPGGLCTM